MSILGAGLGAYMERKERKRETQEASIGTLEDALVEGFFFCKENNEEVKNAIESFVRENSEKETEGLIDDANMLVSTIMTTNTMLKHRTKTVAEIEEQITGLKNKIEEKLSVELLFVEQIEIFLKEAKKIK